MEIRDINNLRISPIDAGPCRISDERFVYLRQLKYQRDLTTQEISDHLAYQFYKAFGYNLDLNDPRTFNEKLNWLKVYYHNPILHQCANKATFHDFVQKRLPGMESHFIKPLAILHKPEELTGELLNSFPEKFVLKSNFGSGAQSFVVKSNANLAQLQAMIARWLNPAANHYYVKLEYSYKDLPPAVIAEPVVKFNYKIEFYCFDGKPFIYWIVLNDKTKEVRANLYRMNGEKLPISWHYPNFQEKLQQPPYFDELVKVSRILSEGFPHVRVDFYAADDFWYFSEMTFFTWAALKPFSAFEYDVILGKQIDLSKIGGPKCA